jgi:hypothetical protein
MFFRFVLLRSEPLIFQRGDAVKKKKLEKSLRYCGIEGCARAGRRASRGLTIGLAGSNEYPA